MDLTARRLVPSDSVRTVYVDDSLVLVDQRSGQYFGLNDAGAEIWRLLTEGSQLNDIIDAIATRYDAPNNVIAADAQRLLDELLNAGLVK